MSRLVRDALRSTFAHIYAEDEAREAEAEAEAAAAAAAPAVEGDETPPSDPWKPRLNAIDTQARKTLLGPVRECLPTVSAIFFAQRRGSKSLD